MRNNKMEKLVLLPFSIGCVTESSVATVAVNHPRSALHSNGKKEEDEESSSSSIKESLKADLHEKVQQLPNTKPQDIDNNNYINFDRLLTKIKGIKNLSNLFAGYYREETEEEETEYELEIGVPTDVKHVTHIGIGTSSSVLSSGFSNSITGTNDKAVEDVQHLNNHHADDCNLRQHHHCRRHSSLSGSSDQLPNLLRTHFDHHSVPPPSPSLADQNNRPIF